MRSVQRRAAPALLASIVSIAAACSGDPTAPASGPANLLDAALFPDCAPTTAYWPTHAWHLNCPSAVGMDTVRLRQAVTTLAAIPDVYAFAVVRHGEMVFEAYRSDGGQGHRYEQRSATKSAISALVGIALRRGELPGIQTTLHAEIPELLSPADDEAVPGITLEQMLSMGAGMSGSPVGPPPLARQLLARPLVRAPGTAFEYDDGTYHLLSVVLKSAVRASPRDYANRYLFGPLGFSVGEGEWDSDDLGIPFGSTGLRLSAREMAKLGFLYLHDGLWDGSRIVPEGWVENSITARPLENLPQGELSYGLGWWLVEYSGHRAYFASGHGGQTITVVPDLDLIVVIAANPNSFGEWQRYRRVIPDDVIPSIGSGAQ